MKVKINKKRLTYALSGTLVVMLTLFIYEVHLHIKYIHSNPPVKTCKTKQIVDDESGLVSYWSFDKIKDDRVEDLSGNKNVGQIKSAINLHFIPKMIKSYFDTDYIFGRYEIVDGVKGEAICLYGRRWVAGGNIDLYNTNKFTVAVWVWRETDKYTVPTIMAKGSWPFDGWWLTTTLGGRGVDMGIAWGTGLKHVESGYELPLREWHHIAVTMNNRDHEIQFFIDGLPFGKKHENVPEWVINWNHELFVGDYDGSGRWPWVGKLDEARFYNKILSEGEIANVYNSDRGSPMVMEEKNNSIKQ